MSTESATWTEPVDQQLKSGLARELCAMFQDCSRIQMSGAVYIDPAEVTCLRHGRLHRFSLARLVRLVARQRYHFELHLRPIPNRFATPRPMPTGTVLRYDRYGRLIDAENSRT